MNHGIRVLIVDDQPRARQSLKALLATMAGIGEVREAECAREAIQSIRTSGTDVVLMDILMPEVDGLQATRIIKRAWPEMRVVVLTLYSNYRQEALSAGADAFVAKGGPSEELFEALLGMQ